MSVRKGALAYTADAAAVAAAMVGLTLQILGVNFQPELAAKVMAGEKTVTRRLVSDNPRSPWWRERCSLKVNHTYAVCPGRGKHAIGRVRIVSVRQERLGWLGADEELREGFTTCTPSGRRGRRSTAATTRPRRLARRVRRRAGRGPPALGARSVSGWDVLGIEITVPWARVNSIEWGAPE
jgi:hypothetical protein